MAKRRRLTPGVWMSAVFGVAILVGAVAVYSGWGRATAAPGDRGVCWRMTTGGLKPAYAIQAKDVANLETCAAHLERLHLMNGRREVAGAYQGRFIFIDTGAIRSSTSLEGARWQVFFGPQRAALDATLKRGGKTPQMFMMPAR